MIIKCPGDLLINMDHVITVEAKDRIVEVDIGRQTLLIPYDTAEEAQVAVETIYQTRASHLDLSK